MVDAAEGRRLSAAPPRRRPGFAAALAGIALVALGLRLLYALAVAPTMEPRGDTLLYHLMAGALAEGEGYVSPASLFAGDPQPTSAYPPLYPLYLAAWSLAGLDGLDDHRAVSCLLGTAAVVLVGLVGRRVGGATTGLAAAGLAAVYPQLVMVDGTATTESIYAPIVALTLLLALRYADAPGAGRAAALGLAIGAAALARSEAVALVVLLAAPLVWGSAGAARPRARHAAALVAAVAVALVPWTARNWIVQDEPILLTSNTGLTALATNCDATYHGDRLGFAEHRCAYASPCAQITDETASARCMRDAARAYAQDNLGRVPVVVGARVARLWGVYAPGTDIGYGELWSRHATVAKAGFAMYAGLLALAALGAAALWRRRATLLVLLAPFALVTLAAALTFGFSRYRLAAEVALCVLAAVGLLHAARRAGAHGGPRTREDPA